MQAGYAQMQPRYSWKHRTFDAAEHLINSAPLAALWRVTNWIGSMIPRVQRTSCSTTRAYALERLPNFGHA
jgi:hypothetical protein